MIYKNYEFNCNNMSCSYNEYCFVIDLIEKYLPKRICEFGCGESTKIFLKYKSLNNAYILSIENDINYVFHNNTKICNIIDFGSIFNYNNIKKYENLENILLNENKFDFAFIDGPIGYDDLLNNRIYSRIQILDFILLDKLSNNSIVLLHDCNRIGEKNTLKEFEILCKKNRIKFNKIIFENLCLYKIKKEILI